MIYYDVVIVGAGPAGATAAYILNQKGYDVLLLDKAYFPREKLCGGCLTQKTLWLLNRVFNEAEVSLRHNNIINYKSQYFEIRCRDKVLLNPVSPLAFYFIDRLIYDHFLLNKVREAGVEVSEGEKVTGLQVDEGTAAGGKPYPLTLITSRERSVTARFIIAADGANSTIRSTLLRQNKINGTQWQRNLAMGLEIFLPRKGNLEYLEFPILSFGYLRYGYAWIFPNNHRLVVGMGGLGRKNKKMINRFYRFLDDYRIENKESIEIRGWPIPFGNSLSQPYYKNILLVGDAAGMVDPMLGEGVYQAHKSGELAAQAIITTMENQDVPHADAGPVYLQLLQQDLLKEFHYARRFRWFLYNPVSHLLRFHHLRLLERHFSKLAEVVHGARTYQWFKKKENPGASLGLP